MTKNDTDPNILDDGRQWKQNEWKSVVDHI